MALTFSNQIGNANAHRILLFSKLPGKSWEGPLALSGGRWDSHSAVVVSATQLGRVAHAVYQHEPASGADEIIYSSVLLQACAATAQAEAASVTQASAAHRLFLLLARARLSPVQPTPPPITGC